MIRSTVLAVFALAGIAGTARSQPAPLVVEAKIPLGAVAGRIDHMAVDLGRGRLFVAELGNDSLGVIDIARRVVMRTIGGLNEPQGVGYLAADDTVFVASGGDGSVRRFAGADLTPMPPIALDGDADNIRIDDSAAQVFVGHGKGGVTRIDRTGRVVADIRLPAHPESFQIDARAERLYVNLPDAAQVGVVDLRAAKQIGAWVMQGVRGNFPLALDPAGGHVLVATRRPPRLLALAPDGKVVTSAALAGDADDLFIDAKRARIYASCGEGVIDVYEFGGTRLERIGQVTTVPGARTSLWVPALDRLFVAARASRTGSAAIWVLRPVP